MNTINVSLKIFIIAKTMKFLSSLIIVFFLILIDEISFDVNVFDINSNFDSIV